MSKAHKFFARELSSREELERGYRRRASQRRALREKPPSANFALREDRKAEKEIYADGAVAKILRNLGKRNPAKPRSLLSAGSAECDLRFIDLYGE